MRFFWWQKLASELFLPVVCSGEVASPAMPYMGRRCGLSSPCQLMGHAPLGALPDGAAMVFYVLCGHKEGSELW